MTLTLAPAGAAPLAVGTPRARYTRDADGRPVLTVSHRSFVTAVRVLWKLLGDVPDGRTLTVTALDGRYAVSHTIGA